MTLVTTKAIVTKNDLDADVLTLSGVNRLAVDSLATLAPGSSQTLTKKLRYVDMNAASGGIARGTSVTSTWTTVFLYSGSGKLLSFVTNVETFTSWEFRLLIDGEEIFPDPIKSDDVATDTIYDLDNLDPSDNLVGISKGSHDRLMWISPLRLPLVYATSVQILIRRTPAAGNKKFQAGLVVLTKET